MRDKNRCVYDGHSNPNWEWRNPKYNYGLDFEEKIQMWKKEANERNRCAEAKEHTKSDTKDKKEENNNRRKIAVKKKNKYLKEMKGKE